MPGIFNMKSSNVPAKSRGVVLFAFNTSTINYVKIAEQAARLIHQTLQLPVTLITDVKEPTEHFDQIVTVEHTLTNFKNGDQTEWRNADRYNAYQLSPYDETLLLDSDYLQLDNSLLKLFDVDFDYKLQHNNHLVNDNSKFVMGDISLPYVWATVVAFRKTAKSQILFDLVGRIQRNYSYYRMLYNIVPRNFRNDYAFAIANSIINGYDLGIDQSIPWTMLSFDKPIEKIELKNNSLIVRQSNSACVIPQQNIHVMDKQYLLSENFNELVNTICQN